MIQSTGTSNTDFSTKRCSTCGHDSSRMNFRYDFKEGRSYEICSYCRNELKENK